MNYASNAKANAGLATGIIGTTLGVLNGAGGLLGMMGGNMGCGCGGGCPDNQYVNRYEMTMAQELAAKDGEIALLKADKYTDEKIIEAYKDLQGQISALAGEVRANKEEQCAINQNQAVLNGTVGCAIQNIQSVIGQITKVSVPNEAVCPGFGNVTVTPAATGTTVA